MTIDLHDWREKHKLTQRELADYLAVSTNTIARWERGELGMAHEHLVVLALEHYDCRVRF